MVSLVVLAVSFRLMIISDDNDGAFSVMSRCLCLTVFSFQQGDNAAAFYYLSYLPSRVNQLVASCCSLLLLSYSTSKSKT